MTIKGRAITIQREIKIRSNKFTRSNSEKSNNVINIKMKKLIAPQLFRIFGATLLYSSTVYDNNMTKAQ